MTKRFVSRKKTAKPMGDEYRLFRAGWVLKSLLPVLIRSGVKELPDPEEVEKLFTMISMNGFKGLNAVELTSLRGYLAKHGIEDWTK